MTIFHILFTYIFLLSSGECIKLMIPHGILREYWHDEFPLSANYAVKLPKYLYGNYSFVDMSNNHQLLYKFEPHYLEAFQNSKNKCYRIYTVSSKPKRLLQICRDDLINFPNNKTLPLAFVSTTSGKQVIINEKERTRNETMWTFTRVHPMFMITTLEMQPFQVTITNANNTKIIAYINYERPKYPYDNYAYKFMILNHTQYSSYESGLLLLIGIIIDDLRTYPKTTNEQY